MCDVAQTPGSRWVSFKCFALLVLGFGIVSLVSVFQNNKEKLTKNWQKNVLKGSGLFHRDILPEPRAKGEKQWPWKDDMPTQCFYCKYKKGSCKTTRISGHGNRGMFSVPESIMLLLLYSKASLQQRCPLMYPSQASTKLILMSVQSLSHFLHPSTPIVVAKSEY